MYNNYVMPKISVITVSYNSQDTIEKTICNKGFMIESCKNVKILQFHSYMNDKELNEIGEYIAYKSEEKFKHYLEELYPVKG